MKIAFIGLGIMGARMAANLIRAGHDVVVYNRSQNAGLQDCLNLGAGKASTPAEAARGREVIFSMLSNPAAVEAVAGGEDGLLAGAAQHAGGDRDAKSDPVANAIPAGTPIWVDCSTVDSAFSRRMHGEAQKHSVAFIDAPVAGSKEPAASGELVFLCGGANEDLKRVEELLNVMGKKTVHAGAAGDGSALKMTINLMLGTSIAAYTEAVALGVGLGLSPEVVQNVLLNTPVVAPVLGALRARIDSGDFTPHFPLQHMHKDLRLAVDAGETQGLPMALTASARNLFALALPTGDDGANEHEDFSAVFRVLNPA
ncbi:MAG: NAD(P)-dependent oxidoreductase [bacterium]|nr:NAD(P)-dependent oxidoreductase [bacterium]